MADAYGVDPALARERLHALLDMFDLAEKQDAATHPLSKAEAKKAARAGALVTGAHLYLLDEPFTGGIDPRGYHALMQVTGELGANRRVTVVFTTQILELAEELADRVALIDNGHLLAFDSVAGRRSRAELGASASTGR